MLKVASGSLSIIARNRLLEAIEQRYQILGMLFLGGKYRLHELARCWVFIADSVSTTEV